MRMEDFEEGEGLKILDEFVEAATRKGSDTAATDCVNVIFQKLVVVAKLDRLSRDIVFVAGLWLNTCRFWRAVFGRDADPFMLHLYAALAEKERRLILKRTRQALAAKKGSGARLEILTICRSRRNGRTTQRSFADHLP